MSIRYTTIAGTAIFTSVVLLSYAAFGCNDGQQSRKEIFDTVWNTINEGFYDPEFGGKDWQKIGEQYRSDVLNAESDELFYRRLNAMLFELDVSHLALIPAGHPEWLGAGDVFAEGDVGIDLRVIDGKSVVTRVRVGSAAEKAGMKPGFTILSVDGKTFADLKNEMLEDKPAPPMDMRVRLTTKMLEPFYGDPGTSLTVVCKDADGKEHKHTIKREQRPGGTEFMEGLPTTYLDFEKKRIESDIGYVRFNMFHPDLLDRILEAIDGMHDTAGLIIDLRGNAGGAIGVRRTLAERMVTERKLSWSYRGRRGVEELYLDPAENPYTGPLVVLVDAMSSSSAEEFPGAMQALGRATIVGERTPGVVLVAEVLPLANGDTLIYPVAETVTSDGKVLEGNGVTPDIKVLHTVEALLAGRDLQLETAIKHIRALDD